jgi:predicted O-methyltransferase YrrM
MNYFLRVYYFLNHFITARNSHGFGVHSPYLFDFVRYVIYEKNSYYIYAEIEKQRAKLLKDNGLIDKVDFGTGESRPLKISEIAANSLCSAKKGQLLCQIVNYLKFNTILELGTSFGISTAYLAANSKNRRCISLEGCEATARIARRTLLELNLPTVEIITGDIDKTLSMTLAKLSGIDFVYIDANHTFDATMCYFEHICPKLNENAVVVLDDIYWSLEMKQAWDKIKSHPKVTSTFDLYHFGIVFFNPDLHPKNYKIRFL